MLNNIITNVNTNENVVALTFDDGPHPVYTPQLLRILENFGAKATFFLVGEAAIEYPHIVEDIANAGHEIGTHTWKHKDLTKIPSRIRRLKLIREGSKSIAPYFTRLIRPPYGAHDKRVQLDVTLLGYKIILWNVSAQDWVYQDANEISQKIISRVAPGNIFLLHDAIYTKKLGQKDSIQDRSPMLNGLEDALATLKNKYRFITVSEIINCGQPLYNWPIENAA